GVRTPRQRRVAPTDRLEQRMAGQANRPAGEAGRGARGVAPVTASAGALAHPTIVVRSVCTGRRLGWVAPPARSPGPPAAPPRRPQGSGNTGSVEGARRPP